MEAHTSSSVEDVIDEIAIEAALGWSARDAALAQANFSLLYLDRVDRRLAAYLDALTTAGDRGFIAARTTAGDNDDAGVLFASAVLALEQQRSDDLRSLFALAEANPGQQRSLLSAFGWVQPNQLGSLVQRLLKSRTPFFRRVAISAYAQHRVDPGLMAARLVDEIDPFVRARALRTAGELGRVEMVSTLAARVNDPDPACSFWAARSAVLLGDRGRALEQLTMIAQAEGPFRAKALRLAVLFLAVPEAHALLQSFAHIPDRKNALLNSAGYVGDPKYVPWLINHMSDDKSARIAGEAFSTITGVDMELLDLECDPPEDVEFGPNDDPEDPDVAMDQDEGLPWPDAGRIRDWWQQNAQRFRPDIRYFMGAPLSREHCIDVLRTGFQRQRIAAAHHLCALTPGQPLFEWRAPSWRQAQQLAQL